MTTAKAADKTEKLDDSVSEGQEDHDGGWDLEKLVKISIPQVSNAEEEEDSENEESDSPLRNLPDAVSSKRVRKQCRSLGRVVDPKRLGAAFACAVTVPAPAGWGWVARNGEESIFSVLQRVVPQVLSHYMCICSNVVT